jgi:putative transposase
MKHKRRSIRLQEYDYSQPGGYFVTMVTHHRACIFGEVVGGKMKLNDYGKIALTEWLRTPILRANVQANEEEFVVMPNHIHGIIWITDPDDQCRGAATLRPYQDSINDSRRSNQDTINDNKINVLPKSLGAIVRSYKSAVTYRINMLRKLPGSPVWQRNYYEHILRGEADCETIHKYILVNPENWVNDPEYIR